MKKKKYHLIACCLLFFSSCQKQNEPNTGYHDSVKVNEVEFEENAEVLKPTYLPELGNKLGDPGDMIITGNYLVVSNNADTDVLQFFSILDDYTHIGNFGSIGQGPNEFAHSPVLTSHGPITRPILSLYDFVRNEVYLINVYDLIQSKELTSAPKISLPAQFFPTQKAAFIAEDSFAIGMGGVEIGKLFKYDSPGDSISAVTPFIPKLSISSIRQSSYYGGRMMVSSDKGIIAVVSDFFKQMEFYDFDLNLLKVMRLEKEPEIITEFRGNDWGITEQTKKYYTDLDSSEEHIYVLFRDIVLGEIFECKTSSRLHVYDWEGNPVRSFILDGCPARVVYDHINNRIISIFRSAETMDSLIGYYQL